MISKIKKSLLSLAAAATLLIPAMVPAVAIAAPADQNTINKNLCGGSTLKLDGNGDCATTDKASQDLQTRIGNFLNVASRILGVVAVIMLIVAGFKYVTSGGNKDGVSGAKNMIVYAIVGLVVVAIAQIIVQFVLDNATLTT